jgi:hypothetical protein
MRKCSDLTERVNKSTKVNKPSTLYETDWTSIYITMWSGNPPKFLQWPQWSAAVTSYINFVNSCRNVIKKIPATSGTKFCLHCSQNPSLEPYSEKIESTFQSHTPSHFTRHFDILAYVSCVTELFLVFILILHIDLSPFISPNNIWKTDIKSQISEIFDDGVIKDCRVRGIVVVKTLC